MSVISEEIKDKLDIIDIIKDYIKIDKKGANYRALCPFHQEKTPSFFVSPAKQIWYCFGACSEGGDIFKFIMKIEGIEYIDALRILANKAGIKLKKPDKETILKESEKEKLYEICEKSILFFEKQLESINGKIVKNYLLNRGVNEKSIKEWRVGYGADSWQGLTNFLFKIGHKAIDIEKAGLIIQKKSGDYFDRFRQRIIFPIFNFNSRIIGFSGRIFDSDNTKNNNRQDESKYINSPTTTLYNKSEILYGFNKAKLEIRKSDFCILVEGYLDVIMLSQSGFKNVVAISGTALTKDHLKIIGRHTKNIYFCFDTDIAGESATKKSIEMALIDDFNIKVVILPEKLDPADVIQKFSIKKFQKYINDAVPILEYFFKIVFKKFPEKLKIEDKKEISKNLLPIIKKISNKIEESYWIQQLSIKLNIKESMLEEELRKTQNIISIKTSFHLNNNIKKTKKELLEEQLLILVLLFNDFVNIINLNLGYSDDFTEIIKFINKEKNILNIQASFSGKLDFLNYLLVKSGNILIEKRDAKEEIILSQNVFKKIKFNEKKDIIIKQIKEAEKNGYSKEIQKLIKKLQKMFN